MSYDIYLRAPACPTCGNCGVAPERLSPTFNMRPIFALAFGNETGIRALDGMTGYASVPMLIDALRRMQDETMRAQFVALEPSNGWGDLRGATSTVKKMLDNAREFPRSVWEI